MSPKHTAPQIGYLTLPNLEGLSLNAPNEDWILASLHETPCLQSLRPSGKKLSPRVPQAFITRNRCSKLEYLHIDTLDWEGFADVLESVLNLRLLSIRSAPLATILDVLRKLSSSTSDDPPPTSEPAHLHTLSLNLPLRWHKQQISQQIRGYPRDMRYLLLLEAIADFLETPSPLAYQV